MIKHLFLSTICASLIIGMMSSVWAQTAQTEQEIYIEGQDITVHFKNLPGNESDWITIVPAESDPSTYAEWYYTKGKLNGSMQFRSDLRPGKYEVRVYFDWFGRQGDSDGYTIQKRYPFYIEKDELRAWLRGLRSAQLTRYSKQLEREITGWKKLADEQLVQANLNRIALQYALDDFENAQVSRTRELKIEYLNAGLDRLDSLVGIVALKGLLRFVTSPPSSAKAHSVALYLLKTTKLLATNNSEQVKLEEALERKTRKGYEEAYKKLTEFENSHIFSGGS